MAGEGLQFDGRYSLLGLRAVDSSPSASLVRPQERCQHRGREIGEEVHQRTERRSFSVCGEGHCLLWSMHTTLVCNNFAISSRTFSGAWIAWNFLSRLLRSITLA